MMDSINLFMRNKVSELARLMREANIFLESRSLPPRSVYMANLALEEILTNIIKYAAEEHVVHEIQVLIEVKDDGVLIRCIDQGSEFNPLSLPPPDMGESILDCQEGGLGIHLLRQMVASIEYERQEGKNILTIRVS